MPAPRQRFGDFILDAANRQLLRDGVPQPLNARYFDALVLLLREHGKLVGKQRFFDEVWAGSVVTDAALTQCIKEVRRVLGDDASAPRFVRTVAGHGYSFIAAVDAEPLGVAADTGIAGATAVPVSVEEPTATRSADAPFHPAETATESPGMRTLDSPFAHIVAATAGGATAGLLGGLLYGTTLAFSPQAQGLGTLSVVLVLLALSMLVGMAGALGVGAGLVGARLLGAASAWMLAGAALGGLVVGGVVKLLGSDTFTLLVGHAPTGITGGLEGAAIGFALALGMRVGGGFAAVRMYRPVAFAALSTGLAGALLPLAGGNMMASSLASVAAAFDGSRIDMAPLARLFGEPQFGLAARAALGAVEGAVFGGCVVAALLLVTQRRRGIAARG